MIPTAKETFLSSPHKADFEKISSTAAFIVACQYALLSLQEEMMPATDPSKGWDSHSRMTGAQRVIQILSTLHEPIEPPKTAEPQTLHYT